MSDKGKPMEPAVDYKEPANPREKWIRELRSKYLDGSLEAILIPEDPKLERLMEDIFHEEEDEEELGSSN
jgi:hypothetical protein